MSRPPYRHGSTSLVLIDRLAKSLDLPFAKNKALGPLVTFTRGSSSPGFDINGLRFVVADNVPVFSHDRLTGTSLGLAIFEARTFTCLHNRDLSQDTGGGGPWALTNITAAKDAVNLDGDANGCSTLIATAANATALQTITAASTNRAATAYIKRKTGTGEVDFTQDGGSTWVDITSSLSTGAFYQALKQQSVLNVQIGVRVVTDTDEIIVDLVGLEAGAFPTPVMETGADAVIRAVDVPTISDVTWLNQSRGTFVTQVLLVAVGTGNFHVAWAVDDGSTANRFLARHDNHPTNISHNTVSFGETFGAIIISAAVAGVSQKWGMTYEQDSVFGAVDGTVSGPDTSADLPPSGALTTMRIGHSSLGRVLNGYSARLSHIPAPVSPAQLQVLVS